jgi:hypothetical protein
MVSNRKVLVGVVFTFLAGCAIGLAIGGHQGFRFGTSFIISEALAKDAREVEARIAILRHLRAGEQDQAIERLETGLSDTLIGFDPSEPYAGLNAQTVAALKKAIDEAKKYRSAHPRQRKDFRDKMVDSLFARELYQ